MVPEGGARGDGNARGPSHAELQSKDDQTEPTGVVASRAGQVLLAHTLLKSDHFPGCQNLKLKPLIDGAPNFRYASNLSSCVVDAPRPLIRPPLTRPSLTPTPSLALSPRFRKIDGLPVYGVAIPTVLGLRNILGQLGVTAKNQRRLVWINLREEPLLYVNGSPYVVRESDKPFANLEYSGIDAARVVEMEDRLKQDVLNEAALYDGSILVAHEDDQFQVVEDWEPVTEVDVQTPLEVYEELTRDGFNVDYLRVPITDEKAPMGDDFEILMRTAWELGESDSIIFNCQMGRGRTTTGMVIACCILLRKAQGHLAPPPVLPDDSLPQWWCSQEDFSDVASPKSGGTADDLKNGMFLSIRSVMRALENGKSAKMALDLILDACAAMQNLREAIATYRKRVFLEPNEIRRQSLLQVCLEYLDRYYSLIVFAAYLDDPGFAFSTKSHVPFSRWVKDRPELLGILERLLRSNPLAALAFDRMEKAEHGGGDYQGGGALAMATRASLEGQLAGREETFAEHIATRPGSVLGPHTILKLDHFKGCQSSRLVNEIDGAPNFRGLAGPGLNVFGGAIATVDGIKRVLHYVGAGPDDEQHTCAVWHMMREEPVVYINGDPYVLREASRPFKNLMEYRGIDAFRLDQMEQRLQDDVIQEAAMMDGQIIVTVEEKDPSGGTSVTDKIIKVTDQSVVETPRQVLEKFQSEGYRVTFIRIPLTDGTCPKPRDFDSFFGAAAASRPNDALIYTCQLGGGRTTTGMCIGTLLRMHLNGAAMPKTSSIDREASLLRLDEDFGSASPRYTTEDLEVDSELMLEDPNRETPRTASKMRVANAPEIDRERVNMENGEYLGVRRFTRTLERGGEVKAEVDAVIDACGVIVNLRTAIMRYRKPKSTEFFRPELRSRHSAFQRGSTYMERYCMLMEFSVYLNECRQKGRTLTFEDWLSTRTDITTAVDGIHQNPAGALAPVPLVPSISALFTPGDMECLSLSSSAKSFDTDKDVSIIEARGVLTRRRGNTIGKRTILKSYTIAGEHHGRNVPPELMVGGISDIQSVDGLPIFTIGNASISGLRKFMHKAGALPGGGTHIIFTDLREELVIYVNGTAYMRREVEMAAAALHHAGIKAVKLEDLERRLRTDVMNESISWGGKILLHRELDADKPGEQPLLPSRLSFETERTFSLRNFGSRLLSAGSSDGSLHGEKVDADSTTFNSLSTSTANPRIAHVASASHEDITKTTSYQTSTFVSAFWERTGDGLDGDIDVGIWTPAEVFLGLAAEGYSLEYKRVPMSRERTPRADDLDQLYLQMNPEVPRGTDCRVLHVFISRTANGSSARFAATFACGCLLGRTDTPDAGGIAAAIDSSGRGPAPPSGDSAHSAHSAHSSHSAQAHHMHRVDSGAFDLTRSIESGEYRGIMSLLRALPRGTDAKEAIDDAIDRCSSIGSITRDILQCKVISEDESGFDGPAGLHLGDALFAKRLGLHYLLRYFYLIAFRAYLYDMERKSLHGNHQGVSFRQWVDERKEIAYLASSLSLE